MFLQGEHLTLVISVWGTDITREMCLGAHISWGNTYHCNNGRHTQKSVFILHGLVIYAHAQHFHTLNSAHECLAIFTRFWLFIYKELLAVLLPPAVLLLTSAPVFLLKTSNVVRSYDFDCSDIFVLPLRKSPLLLYTS